MKKRRVFVVLYLCCRRRKITVTAGGLIENGDEKVHKDQEGKLLDISSHIKKEGRKEGCGVYYFIYISITEKGRKTFQIYINYVKSENSFIKTLGVGSNGVAILPIYSYHIA